MHNARNQYIKMTPQQVIDNFKRNSDIWEMFENMEDGFSDEQIIQMMKEYATLCCEAQRKVCAENAKMRVYNSLYEGYTLEDVKNGDCTETDYKRDKENAPYSTKEFHVDIEDEDYKDYYWKVTIKEDSILNTPITLL